MKVKNKKKIKRRFILKGIRNALICDGFAVVILTAIAFLYALIKNASIIKSIYMSFYYCGGISLIFAVPQFYIKNKDPKNHEVRRLNPFNAFYTWFGSENSNDGMMASYQEFKFDNFWLGIMITVFGATLLVFAVILEQIFFTIPK